MEKEEKLSHLLNKMTSLKLEKQIIQLKKDELCADVENYCKIYKEAYEENNYIIVKEAEEFIKQISGKIKNAEKKLEENSHKQIIILNKIEKIRKEQNTREEDLNN